MAATEYVDVALLRIRRKGKGVRDLLHPSSITITASAQSTPVKTMNRSRNALGYTFASNEFTFELETPQPKSGFEINWREMRRTHEVFDLVRELGDGGRRITSRDCTIDEISEGYNENGEATFRISGKCLDDIED